MQSKSWSAIGVILLPKGCIDNCKFADICGKRVTLRSAAKHLRKVHPLTPTGSCQIYGCECVVCVFVWCTRVHIAGMLGGCDIMHAQNLSLSLRLRFVITMACHTNTMQFSCTGIAFINSLTMTTIITSMIVMPHLTITPLCVYNNTYNVNNVYTRIHTHTRTHT